MTMIMTTGSAAEYRPVSPLAVAALVVGGCSAVAVVSVVAWVVPLVGIVVAVAALRDLGRPGVLKAGRLAAVAGLALAVGFGAQAVTATLVSRAIIARRVRTTAMLWIDAVRARRMDEALAITTIRFSSPGSAADAAAHQAWFSGLDAVQAVVACGDARPAPPRIAPAGTAEDGWRARVPLTSCPGHEAETLVLVVAPRTLPTPRGAVDRWSVTDFALER